LLSVADVVSLHVPEDSSTVGMIGENELAAMKPGALFLNIARGKVTDVVALARALNEGRLRGAAVDVFPKEPASNGDSFETPLQHCPNTILTPHIGGSTEEAQAGIGVDVARKIIQFLDAGITLGSCSLPELNLPRQENSHRLLHVHHNVPGVLSAINQLVSRQNVNIVGQYLKTNSQIGYVVLDIAGGNTPEIQQLLAAIPETIKVRALY
jgi:D-3-phosphoglycerate dehydrogenase